MGLRFDRCVIIKSKDINELTKEIERNWHKYHNGNLLTLTEAFWTAAETCDFTPRSEPDDAYLPKVMIEIEVAGILRYSATRLGQNQVGITMYNPKGGVDIKTIVDEAAAELSAKTAIHSYFR